MGIHSRNAIEVHIYCSERWDLYIIERSLICSPRLHIFVEKYNKNCNIVKYFLQFKIIFYFNIFFKMQFIPVMAKLNFQQPLLITSLSHDSNMLFWYSKAFLLIIDDENSCAA